MVQLELFHKWEADFYHGQSLFEDKNAFCAWVSVIRLVAYWNSPSFFCPHYDWPLTLSIALYGQCRPSLTISAQASSVQSCPCRGNRSVRALYVDGVMVFPGDSFQDLAALHRGNGWPQQEILSSQVGTAGWESLRVWSLENLDLGWVLLHHFLALWSWASGTQSLSLLVSTMEDLRATLQVIGLKRRQTHV